jgi:hypothetical protein
MTHISLTYEDVDLYDNDIELFTDRCWLNDACINFCLKRIEKEEGNHAILLMDAAVVSCLRFQIDDEDEMNELRKSLKISERNILLVPVSDCRELGGSSSHWSMLAYDVLSGESIHMDSSKPHNKDATKSTAHKLAELTGRYVDVLYDAVLYEL